MLSNAEQEAYMFLSELSRPSDVEVMLAELKGYLRGAQ